MFRFKLEFLLRYRRQQEETAMHELAKCIRKTNQVEAELCNLRERSEELVSELNRCAASGMPAALFQMYCSFMDHLGRSSRAAERRLDRMEAQVEDHRHKLVEASVERKMIERFKERQHEAHVREESRLEQISLDELSTISQSRKRHEE